MKISFGKWTLTSLLLIGLVGCSGSQNSSTGDTGDTTKSGGSSTVFDTSTEAFSHVSPTLSDEETTHFFVGKSFFDQAWVTAPSSTDSRDGLGPYFNARSCSACHSRDGRGRPPENGDGFLSMLIRLSIPGATNNGEPKPDPNYGGQLQNAALLGIDAEGTPEVSYTEVEGHFGDNTTYTLMRPSYTISNLKYGNLDASVMMSPRVAPTMTGMGLLEAISESDILEFADENDSNADGISGRPNYVWNVKEQTTTLGRFGWKANQPSVEQQVAGAFAGDIGITSTMFPHTDVTDAQADATRDVESGGDPEIVDRLLRFVVIYSANLAVPARRNTTDAEVKQGESLFTSMGCSKCHRISITSRGETIHPYTDLLLHDMGDDLADNRPDFEATGNEWRTPPLWGIGLVQTVNGHTRFMHDGRARNLEEAILWHGGEGEGAKNNYKAATKAERDALIAFINSL